MESSAGSGQVPRGFADHPGSARPAGGFTSPARDALALPGGDARSVAGGTGPPAATLSASLPTTAADVADRVVALRAAGQKPIEIAMTLHITVGEVRGVRADAERPPGTPTTAV